MRNIRLPRYVFALAATATLAACSGDVKSELGLRREGPDEFAVERKPKLEVPPSFKLRPPAPGEEPLNTITPRDEARKLLIGDREGSANTEATTEPTTEAAPDAATDATSEPATETKTDATPETTPSVDKPAGESSVEKPSDASEAAKNESSGNAGSALSQPVGATESENLFLKNAGAEAKDDDIRSILRKEYNEEQDKGVLDRLQSLSTDNFESTVVDAAGEKERIQTNKSENKPITEGETPAKSINHDKSVFQKIFN